MRQFHSYGPVDYEEHICVERRPIVEPYMNQLIGNSNKGGYFFTIWGARQAGKTWLMRQMKTEIRERYGEQLTIFKFSFRNYWSFSIRTAMKRRL